MPEPSPKDVRFIDSMPRPLIVAFLVFVFAGVGIVVWTFARPPSTRQVALELRRSPPIDSYTHNVIRARLVDFPVTLPAFRAPCPTVAGLIVEGGAAAQ